MIYDITMTIHPEMMVYKNKEEKKVKIKQVNFFEKEGHYESEINFNLHTGTHIDYPLHMIKDGDNSNKENLNALIGPAKVFDLVHVNDKITYEDIKALNIEKDDFVIFKTKNSFDKEFNINFIFVEESAASYLVKKQVRGVGIDALGIERSQVGYPTHQLLLGNNIIILEGAILSDVPEDTYTLYCLPLKIKNVEASPVRAILIK
ncbi:MAG: cyclase family protein [Candidatus Izemoplasmatales bacterium]|nr:cyclase family protein [Candidatus Izemoplasmatales bacterium]